MMGKHSGLSVLVLAVLLAACGSIGIGGIGGIGGLGGLGGLGGRTTARGPSQEELYQEYRAAIDRMNEYLDDGDAYRDQSQYDKAAQEYRKALAELDKADRLSDERSDRLRMNEELRKLVEDCITAVEQERQDQATANAKGVTAADFAYDLTSDGKGVVITDYKANATIVNIPATIEGFPVREIKSGVFGSSNEEGQGKPITSITIPDGVTSIGANVFRACTRLKTVNLPVKLETIGGSAFEGCSSLENIVIPDTVNRIGIYAFNDCKALKTLTLPENLVNLGANGFMGCASLESISLPNGLTIIEEETFSGCIALKSIKFPAKLQSIGSNAFRGCTSLRTIALPDSVTEMYEGAFANSGLTEVIFPQELTKISIGVRYATDYGAFAGCTSLKSVTINAKLADLGGNTFGGWAVPACTALETITFNGNTNGGEGWNALNGCNRINTINVAQGVTSLRVAFPKAVWDRLPLAKRAELQNLGAGAASNY
jgi:hypothetical protein